MNRIWLDNRIGWLTIGGQEWEEYFKSDPGTVEEYLYIQTYYHHNRHQQHFLNTQSLLTVYGTVPLCGTGTL